MLSSNSVDLYSSFFFFFLSSLLRVTNIILLPPGWTLILETSTRVWRTELRNQSQLQFCQAHWNTEMKSNHKQSSENVEPQDFLQYWTSHNPFLCHFVRLSVHCKGALAHLYIFIHIYTQGPCTVIQSSWATPACFFSHSVVDLLMCSGWYDVWPSLGQAVADRILEYFGIQTSSLGAQLIFTTC